MITLVIPSYNNLKHIKNAYTSIRKHYPEINLILLDDGSNDGTWEWLSSLIKTDLYLTIYKSEERVGHTILYDKGIELAKTDIVGILHADMLVGPNYIENLLKHLKPQTVVCATRIEPPLHPEGKEKIVRNFGLDFDDLNVEAFEEFALEAQNKYKDQTTRGMFAPWVIYKDDFEAIGGHDPGFAPFPYEDSDIFQRWILAGYELIQSRDSFVYHLTCRGHRWNEQVGKNDDYFTIVEKKAREYYIKKWGSWIKNNEYQYPTIIPVYKKKLILTNPNPQLEEALNIWFNGGEDIIVEVDGNTFTQQDFQLIQYLNIIVKDSGSIGEFKIGNLKITINSLKEYQKDLIKL
jgi:glycosyltransferase involved in cell wall biosynthesis